MIMREKLHGLVSFFSFLFMIFASTGLQPWAIRLGEQPENLNEDVDLLFDMFWFQEEDQIHVER